ncbi:MAG: hypothetical protein ABI718_17915 [Acidobacteriota bacterium]
MKVLIGVLRGIALLLAMMTLQSCSRTQAGPNGGDVVPLNNGAKAEVVANADTGEVIVHTWDQKLETRQGIASKPMMIGSGSQTTELQPYPTSTDRPGLCSRFYGQASWMRGGKVSQGWLGSGADHRSEFAWNNCWTGGAAHGSMWTEMGDQRSGMMGRGMLHGAPGGGMSHQ